MRALLHAPGRCRAFTALTLALTLGAALATQASAASYEVFDLGAGVAPRDINNAGVIVGSRLLPDQSRVGFRIAPSGTLEDLKGTIEARAIDDEGRIVGSTAAGAFLFDKALVPLGEGSSASGINANGLVAGGQPGSNPYRPSPLPINPAFYKIARGKWKVLNVANVYPRGTRKGVYADVYALADINDNGYAVGTKSRTGLYGSAVFTLRAKSQEVNFLSIPNGRAAAVNNLEHIVGSASFHTDSGMYAHAFLHDGTSLVDLGTLNGGLSSSAADINENDEVVGSAWLETVPTSVYDPTSYHAFLWANSLMSDLNDALPPNPGWLLTAATAINDQGDIVGTGLRGGVAHGFLLRRTGP